MAHSQFKVFISTPIDGVLDPAVAAEVSAFVEANKVAAKSVGIEYLEQADKLVLSLGYSTEEVHTPVKLTCVSLGRLPLEAEPIEKAMAVAAEVTQNVICHEFYVDDAEFYVILLSTV